MTIFSEAFYIAICSISAASFSLLLAHCFRLKYSDVTCFGFNCKRDIQLENENYENELNHEHPLSQIARDIIPSPTRSTNNV